MYYRCFIIDLIVVLIEIYLIKPELYYNSVLKHFKGCIPSGLNLF